MGGGEGAPQAAPKGMKPKGFTFVTGNANKLREVAEILGDEVEVIARKLDLPELQGAVEEIAVKKALLAAKEVGGGAVVEDTCLCFHAMGGLPGPYIKWFLESLGHDGLNRMLAGFDDKRAYALCTFAYARGPDDPDVQVFSGRTEGVIVPARGPANFGWDPIFQPHEGDGLTYAEMAPGAKNAISHRGRAVAKLRAYFLDE